MAETSQPAKPAYLHQTISDSYIATLAEAYPVLQPKDQNIFRRLAIKWEKSNSQQVNNLFFTVASQADYKLILSRAFNSWLLYNTFPEQMSKAIVVSSLDYLHGLQKHGGRSLVAVAEHKSCYFNHHSAISPNGSFWQLPLDKQGVSTTENSLLVSQYLQLICAARNLFPPAGAHYKH